jgi:hypothetical protein
MQKIEVPIADRKPLVIIALDPNGRALMTRDMELIRKILLAIQERKTAEPQSVDIADVDPAMLARHLEMLHDAQYIDAVKSGPPLFQGRPYPTFAVKDLTWAGHDFAAAIEDETVWGTIKKTLAPKQLAGLPLQVVKDVAMGLLTHQIKSTFGL